ncbi:major facilitator superfamily domain-containing protein [Mycena olivaceomarginata]|nr:major facilitator superfamily domain-containing protein [Mycena olivaceomarginata]
MSAYFPVPDTDEDIEHLLEDADEDPRTQLDKTIDRIGMGSYQWTLLCLCGFGWMADNQSFSRASSSTTVPDSYIGIVSSTMFAGMMLGAVGWGTCSDLIGRSTAFNATLFFTALFGILASFSWSYPSLCVLLFFLGTAVGGSMPTDGTLLLEHMPHNKLHLVTGLSLFFLPLFALVLVPQNSCVTIATTACDPALNNGWKHLLAALGILTLTMFVARIVFFRLYESPRFLVHAGRPAEAIEALQLIALFNGAPVELVLADVDDTASYPSLIPTRTRTSRTAGRGTRSSVAGHGKEEYVRHWAHRWFGRVRMVLVPEWRRTSLLVWGAWCGMALAYTMFNVFLPKLLESSGTKSIEEGLWDVLVYTLGGCPGALVGAKLILTPLGRRWSLAGSTLITAAFCIMFVFAQSAELAWAVRLSAIGVGLASTTIGGMIAPILGGVLLLFSRAAPVYTSMVTFVFAAGCVLLLSEDAGEGGRSRAARRVKVVVH